jgi:hypothetical protein
MAKESRITSVLELSKWKIGDSPYWLIFKPKGHRECTYNEETEWAFTENVHPKVLHERGYIRGSWNNARKLPRLHASDFGLVVSLLSCQVVIEKFHIRGLSRCPDTGEFIYMTMTENPWADDYADDEDDEMSNSMIAEFMPESNLFATLQEAKRERTRILTLGS